MILEVIFKIAAYLLLLNIPLIPSIFKDVTLERVFSSSHLTEAAEDNLVTLIVTGDILPGRSVQLKYMSNKDPDFAFSGVASVLKSADITWVNLEGPLVSGCPVFYIGFKFCGDPQLASGLKSAGVDIANIANNHIYNFGSSGRTQTINILKTAGLGVTGEEQVNYREVKGVKFAFLGFDVVGRYADRAAIANAIRRAKEKADVVIPQFHWGQEYTYYPQKAGEDPIALSHFAVDAGADLVVGNHPHWIQGIEFYQGIPIVYSHGNFVFDQMWSKETAEGMVGKYVFYKGRLADIEFLPVVIDPPFVPRFAAGSEKQRLLKVIEEASDLLGN